MKNSGLNPYDLFIHRPVTTLLMILVIWLCGAVAYRWLPLSDMQDIDYPTIVVSANLPGASPETIAAAITTPLEQQLSTITGLETMSSVSSQGLAQITLQFSLDRSFDRAAQDVQFALNAASPVMPVGMSAPPSFHKVNPAATPILYLSLSAENLPLATVNQYAESLLARRLSTIKGVGQVNVYGAQKYAVRIQINPNKLFSNGLGVDEVANSIRRNNVDISTGMLAGGGQSYPLKLNGQLTNAKDYRELPLTYVNNKLIRLQDVATVADSVQYIHTASWENGKRAIVLAIQAQPGSNSIAVIDQIKQLLPQFKQQLPAGVKLSIVDDRSIALHDSVNKMQRTLLFATALIILVSLLFLGNLTAAIMVAIVSPLSIISTFGVMYLLKINLENLSLLALLLSMVYAVSNGIIVVEQIFRRREQGESAIEAALNGSRQIVFTLLSMILILVAVMIPLLLLNGQVGRWYYEFGMTVMVAIVCSAFISLTLIPMLASKMLKIMPKTEQAAWQRWLMVGYRQLTVRYERSLQWAMTHHRIFLSIVLVMLVASILFFYTSPKSLLGDEYSVSNVSKGAYQFTLQSADSEPLYHWATMFEQEMKKNTAVQNVSTDMPAVGPQIEIKLLRDKMAALGITAEQIENVLAYAYGGKRLSTVSTPEGDNEVLIELLPAYQENPTMLSQLYIRTNGGALVPLKSVTDMTLGKGLTVVNHRDQLPSVTISFNLKPGTSLNQAVNAIEKIKSKLHPPLSLITGFQGTAKSFQFFNATAGILLLIMILTVYITLGMLYESLIHPITILSGLPVAALGALLSLKLFHMALNLYSFIGMVMLIGFTLKNAMMIINRVLEIRRQGNSQIDEVVFQACLQSFRPMMMTTIAALAVLLSFGMIFANSSEIDRSLVAVMIGGMLFSQLLTLYTTPVVYLYLDRCVRWFASLGKVASASTDDEMIEEIISA